MDDNKANNLQRLNKENILQCLYRRMIEDPTSGNEIKYYQTLWRGEDKEKEQHKITILKNIAVKYGTRPKDRATDKELTEMITMVLETGKTGRKIIPEYADKNNKPKEWRSSIAKSRAGQALKTALKQFDNHEVILSMKENDLYNKKDINEILNNSVTGALSRLSKQRKISKRIDDLENKVATLEKNLAAKIEGKDWKEEALKLHKDKLSCRKIAVQLGVSKTTIADFIKDKKNSVI